MTALAELKRRLRPGQVYRRKDLARWSNAVDRHVRALVDEGRLEKAGPGLYMVPRTTRFGPAPPKTEKLVESFLEDDRFLVVSPSAYTGLGVGATQLYNEPVVYNRKRHGRFTLDGRTYDFRRRASVPGKLTRELLLVELLHNLDRLPEDKATLLPRALSRARAMDRRRPPPPRGGVGVGAPPPRAARAPVQRGPDDPAHAVARDDHRQTLVPDDQVAGGGLVQQLEGHVEREGSVGLAGHGDPQAQPLRLGILLAEIEQGLPGHRGDRDRGLVRLHHPIGYSSVRLLLLLPTAAYRAEDFLTAAERLDAEVVVGTDRRQALAGLMEDRAIILPLRHPRRAVRAIEELAGRAPLDAVVPVDDRGVEVAALASERLGLPHNTPDGARASRDKATMRRRFAEARVPQPAFRVAGPEDDVAALAREVGVPVVVNTSLNTAGRPMVDSPRDALECFGSSPVDALAIGPFLVRRSTAWGGGP
jgi:hypothetical protein